MYRKGTSKSDRKDQAEREEARRTRDSFIRSILYPQNQHHHARNQIHTQQYQQQYQQQYHREQLNRGGGASQASFPILPQVSPHHLSEPTMIPIQSLPLTEEQQPHTPQDQDSRISSLTPIRYSPNPHSSHNSIYRDQLYNNQLSFQYLPSEAEDSQGVEIITPDLNSGRRDFQTEQQFMGNSSSRQQDFAHFTPPRQSNLYIQIEGKKQEISNPNVICNCAKSRCLKLYCDCFQAGDLCNTFCRCKQCLNTESESMPGGELHRAKKEYLLRKPNAFGKKVKTSGSESCSCRNNRCLKKYCLCFRRAVSCTDMCACVSCANKSASVMQLEADSGENEDDKKRSATERI